MKTTIDLDDELLLAAKALAVRRRTTLKGIITHALRREVGAASDPDPGAADGLEVGPFGILRLQPRGAPVTDALVGQLLDAADDEDLQRALRLAGKA